MKVGSISIRENMPSIVSGVSDLKHLLEIVPKCAPSAGELYIHFLALQQIRLEKYSYLYLFGISGLHAEKIEVSALTHPLLTEFTDMSEHSMKIWMEKFVAEVRRDDGNPYQQFGIWACSCPTL